jgi:dTDP-4-dehydrorhamnose 3,5-epimerase
MKPFKAGPIEGVLLKTIKKIEDPRGWLAELFREDEVGREIFPVMSYASITKSGTQRGPHEHEGQTG